jgi:hypothetical protein
MLLCRSGKRQDDTLVRVKPRKVDWTPSSLSHSLEFSGSELGRTIPYSAGPFPRTETSTVAVIIRAEDAVAVDRLYGELLSMPIVRLPIPRWKKSTRLDPQVRRALYIPDLPRIATSNHHTPTTRFSGTEHLASARDCWCSSAPVRDLACVCGCHACGVRLTT